MENRCKRMYLQLNLTAVDFDSLLLIWLSEGLQAGRKSLLLSHTCAGSDSAFELMSNLQVLQLKGPLWQNETGLKMMLHTHLWTSVKAQVCFTSASLFCKGSRQLVRLA